MTFDPSTLCILSLSNNPPSSPYHYTTSTPPPTHPANTPHQHTPADLDCIPSHPHPYDHHPLHPSHQQLIGAPLTTTKAHTYLKVGRRVTRTVASSLVYLGSTRYSNFLFLPSKRITTYPPCLGLTGRQLSGNSNHASDFPGPKKRL
jgi:hypothetical protein